MQIMMTMIVCGRAHGRRTGDARGWHAGASRAAGTRARQGALGRGVVAALATRIACACSSDVGAAQGHDNAILQEIPADGANDGSPADDGAGLPCRSEAQSVFSVCQWVHKEKRSLLARRLQDGAIREEHKRPRKASPADTTADRLCVPSHGASAARTRSKAQAEPCGTQGVCASNT